MIAGCGSWSSPQPGEPLRHAELPEPEARPGREVLLDVHACGVCRTDLHIVDGELTTQRCRSSPATRSSAACSGRARRFARRRARRRAVAGLDRRRRAAYCRSGRENLCAAARFTGYDLDGGYAECAVADERFCFPLPDGYPTTCRRRRCCAPG